WGGSAAKPGRLAVLGPLVLAALLAAVSVRGLLYEREATDGGFTPGHVEPAALEPLSLKEGVGNGFSKLVASASNSARKNVSLVISHDAHVHSWSLRPALHSSAGSWRVLPRAGQ
ncbi:MAG: hypothetical protein KF805_17345, partial [Phycisphaeraceae bacterium]|nr:hypothetical protein [Phycisphaeraceae bacterium]